MGKTLDSKEQSFAEKYSPFLDVAEIARRAGYQGEYNELMKIGERNLKNPAILKLIKREEKEPVVYCKACETVLKRKEKENGTLEDLSVFKRRKYCNAKCAQHRDRPYGWQSDHAKARKHKRTNCEACGIGESLQVHHVDSDPKNNDVDNLQTLCVWCHNFLHAAQGRLELDIPGRMPELSHNG